MESRPPSSPPPPLQTDVKLIREWLRAAERHFGVEASMAKNRGEIPVEESCGNVFADLGLRHPEECLAKADLAIAISREVRARGLTQVEAADLLGVAQPDVSNLMRARLSGYSIERLTRLLSALGQDVEIRVRPTRQGKERGYLRVALG